MQKELELGAPIFSNGKIKWQSETCICDLGDLCNGGNNLMSDNKYLLHLILLPLTYFVLY